MFISNTHRAIFIHIPKTAGTSITQLVEPHLRWNDLVLGGSTFGERIQPAYQERFGLSKHMRARDVRRVVGSEIWAGYFSCAVVRHPYSRIISFFNWKRAAVARAAADSPVWSWPATAAFQQSRSFSEFIRHEKFLASRAGQPQAEWVCDDDGRCIVDFVGRFEQLEAATDEITARLGLPPAELGVHNTSSSDRPLGELMQGEDDYRFLQDVYRRDFELFGFDPALRL